MSLYARPFNPSNVATGLLQVIPQENLDFLYSCLDIHPKYNEIILKLADIIQKASHIYHVRVVDAPEDTIARLVHDFLAETSSFNAASPGGHILIWPFFIVGTECSSPTDRDFVVSQLRMLWGYTGFGNTLYAIKILKKIWQENGKTKSGTHVFDKVKGFIM
ncbi:hypothetical protein N7509_009728 [Penicillium cosmopolitanum]|uniref:Uncharacterized protein n=1 Tax=Penicillium cosmopolitanum TaxID=1131564 RepID=A0A9X0B3X9_9EURO|nr:uncharacterized protein N7509_009728 [Penicillium cosmopolitanum]KAJ5387187.1 hypothetical protein N7509_009728 [Penicillium cosmopolitanum]